LKFLIDNVAQLFSNLGILNRTVNSDDDSIDDVSDTGGNLLVPLKVTLPAISASNTQNTDTSAQTLRTVLNTFRNDIAWLFIEISTLASSSVIKRYAEYPYPGTYYLTIPNNVRRIRVTACAGGGASNSTGQCGRSGGGGTGGQPNGGNGNTQGIGGTSLGSMPIPSEDFGIGLNFSGRGVGGTIFAAPGSGYVFIEW